MPENNIVLKHIEIAKKIYKYIIDNKILKGDKLPGGRTFAVKYNVSKNTVYEALELLQADGYVVIKKDSGTFVTDKVSNIKYLPVRFCSVRHGGHFLFIHIFSNI